MLIDYLYGEKSGPTLYPTDIDILNAPNDPSHDAVSAMGNMTN